MGGFVHDDSGDVCGLNSRAKEEARIQLTGTQSVIVATRVPARLYLHPDPFQILMKSLIPPRVIETNGIQRVLDALQ
jgi:hypothetical protein